MIVTSRASCIACANAASSDVRPTNDVSCNGRLPEKASSERNGGKSCPQLGREDLEHPLGSGEVAQAMLAEVAQLGRGQQIGGRLRDQHLTAVADCHQACGAVDVGAEVVAVALDGFTGMDSDAYRREALGLQRPLGLDRGLDRVTGAGERDREAVATGGEDVAAVLRDRAAQDRVVSCERVVHRRGVVLPPSGRTHDVGEEERDRPGRCSRHSVRRY